MLKYRYFATHYRYLTNIDKYRSSLLGRQQEWITSFWKHNPLYLILETSTNEHLSIYLNNFVLPCGMGWMVTAVLSRPPPMLTRCGVSVCNLRALPPLSDSSTAPVPTAVVAPPVSVTPDMSPEIKQWDLEDSSTDAFTERS